MKKNLKIRISSAMLSLTLLGSSFALLNPKKAHAEAINYNPGTIIEEPIERNEDEEIKLYYQYVVKEGDSLSAISRKICKFFEMEPTEKFWPVLAYLNNVGQYIFPGDILLFPNTYEALEELLAELKENGWTDNYITLYDVYSSKEPESVPSNNGNSNDTNSGNADYPMQYSMYVRDLMEIIYGDQITVDDEFISLVIRTLGLEGRFTANSFLRNNDEIFLFTDWIPSLEQLGITGNTK